ncbi:MAG: HXXEE domain-containing protein [Chitinophagaceae bacterium]|nr:HXXEE domain-containing protein [Chitinophagaceae bacterium]MCW5915644.1 HXXEE domain-containing protein [Chitinophagaceae bacterium]MCZ2397441.1 HXXEE domain-containing protein [Chitinophagales bacterium]
MNLLRRHWYDLGGALAIITLLLVYSFRAGLSEYQLLMWLNLVTLFLHQIEEYRLPGTFPGMINSAMFHSDTPDRYPLNTQTSFIVNVSIGWTLYLLAALAGSSMVWLGMASIMVSLGNIIAHTFLFNIKGKTIYNAGIATCWLLFVPCVFFFFKITSREGLAGTTDYIIGISSGILINIFGVLKPIQWLADRNTTFAFRNSQLLPKDRKGSSGS